MIDLVYDAELDRFFATSSRMGHFGVQVTQAEDGQELAYVTLERYPETMALNPSTHHLWIALTESGTGVEDRATKLVAFDTRTIERVAELEVPGMVSTLAVDSVRGLVHAGTEAVGAIHTVQDVPTSLPVGARELEVLPTRPLPTASPTPTCALMPDPLVTTAWAVSGGVAGLGCAVGPARDGDWASQSFQRGEMFWHGSKSAIFVAAETGRYVTVGDSWREGMPVASCEAASPPGLLQPVRGFGLVWCREAGVREMLGWASGPEQGFRGTYQSFARGAILRGPDERALVFRSNGRWEAR